MLRDIALSKETGRSLKALWGLSLLSRNGRDEKGEADAERALRVRFAKSPEYAMLSEPAKGMIVLAPVPTVFLESGLTDYAPPAAEPSGSSKTAPRVAVQAGSYQMKENADDLVSILAREGFAPTIREQVVQGRNLYKVFAGTSLDAAAARALLAKLRAAGFSGFIVNER
jgi:cell division protein FtsN